MRGAGHSDGGRELRLGRRDRAGIDWLSADRNPVADWLPGTDQDRPLLDLEKPGDDAGADYHHTVLAAG